MATVVAHSSQPLRCSLDAGVEAVLLAGCDVGSTTFAAPVTVRKHTSKRLKVWKPRTSQNSNAEARLVLEQVKSLVLVLEREVNILKHYIVYTLTYRV